MTKLKSPRTWILLALTGITIMALSIVQMTSAEAAAPDKPHTLTGVAHHDMVVLHWSSPTSGAAPTGYKIYRKKIGSSDTNSTVLVDDTEITATTYTDGTVVGGKKYTYWVAAVNIDGESAGRTGGYHAIVARNERTERKLYKSHSLKLTGSGPYTLRWKVISTHRVTGYKISRRQVLSIPAEHRVWTVLSERNNGMSFVDDGTGIVTGMNYAYVYRVQAYYRPQGCSNTSCERLGAGTNHARLTHP